MKDKKKRKQKESILSDSLKTGDKKLNGPNKPAT
jgi:hypothetical protein